jgi:hypothetical protein
MFSFYAEVNVTFFFRVSGAGGRAAIYRREKKPLTLSC